MESSSMFYYGMALQALINALLWPFIRVSAGQQVIVAIILAAVAYAMGLS